MSRSLKVAKAHAIITITDINGTTNVVTTSSNLSALGIIPGMRFVTDATIGGLTGHVNYWILKILSNNTFTVSETELSANINSVPMDLSTVTGQTVSVSVVPVDGYFNNPNSGVGYPALNVSTYSVVGGNTSILGTQLSVGVAFGISGIGSISTTTTANTVSGVGTDFINAFSTGTVVFSASGTKLGTIATIANATSATFVANSIAAVTNSSFVTATPEDGFIIRQKGKQKYLVKGISTGITGAVYTYNGDRANLTPNTCSMAVTYANSAVAYTQSIRNHASSIFSEASGPVATGNINFHTSQLAIASFNPASANVPGQSYPSVSLTPIVSDMAISGAFADPVYNTSGYVDSLAITGGTGPYTFVPDSNNALPPGLTVGFNGNNISLQGEMI